MGYGGRCCGRDKKNVVGCNKYNILNGPKIGPTKPNFK